MKNIVEFIEELKINVPESKKFLELSKIFPINPKFPEKSNINFDRGMLLYSLIAKLKPKNILEIGTAEGYSTLCMAWGLSSEQISGKIFTIDPKSHYEKISRSIKIGEKFVELNCSRHDLWKKFAPPEWINKINVITGYSEDVLDQIKTEIDFVYIDGSHSFENVKFDFFSSLKLVSNKFTILFDDYIPDSNDGVKKLIDEEISKKFIPTYIITNTKQQRKEMNLIQQDLIMCLIDNSLTEKSIWEIYDKRYVDNFLKNHHLKHRRLIFRRKLEKKIPFLSKIRFRWWKK